MPKQPEQPQPPSTASSSDACCGLYNVSRKTGLVVSLLVLVLVGILGFVLSILNTTGSLQDLRTSPLFSSDSKRFSATSSSSHSNDKQQQQHDDDLLLLPPDKKKYVVLSCTINEFARAEDYAFLAPLSARNWDLLGFHPILVVVATNMDDIDKVLELWNIILAPHTYIVPVVLEDKSKTISVAQISRLYAASVLAEKDKDNNPQDEVQLLHPDSFLRVTDADMMVLNPSAFDAPPKDVPVDITIFNGNCCKGKNAVGSKVCNQYPMHSVGMKVGLWRKLFPLDHATVDATQTTTTTTTTSKGSKSTHGNNNNIHAKQVAAMVSHIQALMNETFSDLDTDKAVQHGKGKKWYMDQLILGCTIDLAIEDGYTVELAPGPVHGRLHVPQDVYKYYTDAHLAGFNLAQHESWLDNLVKDTVVLMGNQDKYYQYKRAWKQQFTSPKT